jgi:hypothetical protein
MSPRRPPGIGPVEWAGLSLEEKAELAAIPPEEVDQWRAAREQREAEEWQRRGVEFQEQEARIAAGEQRTQPVEAMPRQDPPHPLGTLLAALGAIGVLVGAFLPQADSSQFQNVSGNSLIQSGDGWILIAAAIGIAGGIFAAYQPRAFGWGVATIVIGAAVAAGVAIYDGTGDRLTVESTAKGAVARYLAPKPEQASAGTGIYVAGVGAGLAAIGGLVMLVPVGGLQAGRTATVRAATSDQAPRQAETKECPDCAETILVAARVCKHCGYRFESKPEA